MRGFSQPDEFMQLIAADARACAAATGMPLAGLIATPALETGWGRSLWQQGINTHNLFNVKGKGPAGAIALETTEWLTEAEWRRLAAQGIVFRLTGRAEQGKLEGVLLQSFRCYHSYSESYADFHRILQAKPRFRPVLRAREPYWFCSALQLTGYATDPSYAEKLHAILAKRVIPWLNDQRLHSA